MNKFNVGDKVIVRTPGRYQDDEYHTGTVDAVSRDPEGTIYMIVWDDGMPSSGWYSESRLQFCDPPSTPARAPMTHAEQAVIEAALAQTGPRSPRLAMAINRLRAERGLSLGSAIPHAKWRKGIDGLARAQTIEPLECKHCGADIGLCDGDCE